MCMRHRDHQNAAFVRVIDQAVREPAQPAAANVLAEWMPRIGKLPDPLDRRDGFEQKCIAQACHLTVVVRDRFVELPLGDFEDADVRFPRYFASTCSSGIALISPRRLAARRSSASLAQSRSIFGSGSSRLARISSTSRRRSEGDSLRAWMLSVLVASVMASSIIRPRLRRAKPVNIR